MEPTYTVQTNTRRFRTEAEYRLWQHETGLLARRSTRPGLVRRLAAGVRSLLTRPATMPAQAQPATRRDESKRQTQTIARVTK